MKICSSALYREPSESRYRKSYLDISIQASSAAKTWLFLAIETQSIGGLKPDNIHSVIVNFHNGFDELINKTWIIYEQQNEFWIYNKLIETRICITFAPTNRLMYYIYRVNNYDRIFENTLALIMHPFPRASDTNSSHASECDAITGWTCDFIWPNRKPRTAAALVFRMCARALSVRFATASVVLAVWSSVR